MKAKSYDEKYEGDLELSTVFSNRLNDLKNEIKVQLPCRVVSVDYPNNQVNVEILDYDSDNYGNLIPYPIIPNVPIRQPMTSGSAYIILPVIENDIGTIEFFDTSVKDLMATGNFEYDFLEEWHSLDNGLFTNGFLPNSKIFNVPQETKLVIGTTTGSVTIKINADDSLDVIAPTLNITSNVQITGDLNVTGTISADKDVVAQGKSGAKHTHTDGQGKTTSAPN